MSDDATLPPARERNRFGVRPYTENPPDAAEALLDRVEIRVHGVIHADTEAALDDFMQRLGTGTHRLFGIAHRRPASWRAEVVEGSTISTGAIAVSLIVPDAQFEIKLVVNPIRTLAHLLDQHSFDDLAHLSAFDFFTPAPEPTAPQRTLDRNDNMVSDLRAFAGSFHGSYLQRVAQFLDLFEAALRRRLLFEMCPSERGFEHAHNAGVSGARNGLVSVRLDWSTLTVSQCEVCWERYDPDALERVKSMADGVLGSARSAMIVTYPDRQGPSVARNLGAISIQVPSTPSGSIAVAIYAKALDRLRVEVRYRKNVGDLLRRSLSRPATLVDWFDAIRQNAAARLRWVELHRLLRASQQPSVDALAELLAAIADVTDKAKSKRRGLIKQLLLHGSVTATNRDGPFPANIVERLANRQVLEYVRLIEQDARVGRRYRLAPKYEGLTDLV